jgi:hypothetical protein
MNRRGAEDAEECKDILATDGKSDAHRYCQISNYSYLCASDFKSVAKNSFLRVLRAFAVQLLFSFGSDQELALSQSRL